MFVWLQTLYDVAENVKGTKESLRLKVLLQDLESVHDTLQENITCLPLKPSLEVNGIQVKTCSYFPSNTLPLKISFLTVEKNVIPAIFKVCLDGAGFRNQDLWDEGPTFNQHHQPFRQFRFEKLIIFRIFTFRPETTCSKICSLSR